LMHASWNALVRFADDRFASMLLLALTQGGFALLLLPFVPVPAREAWPFVALGAFLHTGYKLFLIRAYAHGELSQVYPLARGSAPLMVAVAGFVFFGERLGPQAMLSVAMIGIGVVVMTGAGASVRLPARAILYALGTAGFTAAYTLADAAGARVAGSAIGFAAWMFVVDGVAMTAFALATRGSAVLTSLRPGLRNGAVAGALSLGSYTIVIWAFTQAPVAMVAALRETSVLFAVAIAALLLGEQVAPRRWAAALIIAAGVATMRL
ncbi:MAG: EamA family transporter, partial [Sphingomonadaceae bacterium]|nr:EamA family transporter [Sphingomonadaceae bacterium]